MRDIDEGSRPSSTYYVLLGISQLLAGFALIVDSDALAEEPNASLGSLAFSLDGDGIEVLVTATTPRPLTPAFVERAQEMPSARLGEPVRLFVRARPVGRGGAGRRTWNRVCRPTGAGSHAKDAEGRRRYRSVQRRGKA